MVEVEPTTIVGRFVPGMPKKKPVTDKVILPTVGQSTVATIAIVSGSRRVGMQPLIPVITGKMA